MLVSEFYTKTSYALRGTDEDAPTHGDDEATYWLSVLNTVKDNFYDDVTKQWRAGFKETTPNEPGTVATTGTTTLTGTGTYFTDYRVGDKITVSGETVRTIATITSDTVLTVTVAFSNTASSKTFTHSTIIETGVETYNLHRLFLAPSDKVYVTSTTGQRLYYDIIQPQDRNTVVQEVFISDENPETINFSGDIISTTNLVGGVLTVPGYYKPADLTAATDTLPFTSPNWAVYAVASEVAFNDITYEDKAGDLLAKANNLYSLMISKSRRGTRNNPRTSTTNVYRIKSTDIH